MTEKLLSVEEALERLSVIVPKQLVKEKVPLQGARERVLAEDVIADFDSPRFSNSSMDGFAIRAEDSRNASRVNPVRLKIVADIPAGKPTDIEVGFGETARIMTGAQVPTGTDCIIPIEDTNLENSNEPQILDTVEIFRELAVGDYLRPKGEDFKKGEKLLAAGTFLIAPQLGVLAMCGYAEVSVFKKPRVALFSTGDELLNVEESLTSGKIRDTNTYSVKAILEDAGAEVLSLGIAPDNREAIVNTFNQALDLRVDLIITTAGVSVGAYDFLKEVVEANGKLNFWRVNMRPGKPLVFGHYEKIPYVGLPGNPVSSFIGTEVFLRPIINRMQGFKNWIRDTVQVLLTEDIYSDGRETYFRGIVDFSDFPYKAKLTGHQGSGNLYSLVLANSLIVIPSGVKFLKQGEVVSAWKLS